MITSTTSNKLTDIIRDTWPNLYRPPADFKPPALYNLPEVFYNAKSTKKQNEDRYEIRIGSQYQINSPTSKKHNRIVEVLDYIYDKDDTFFSPCGVKIKYLDTNRKGTYYTLQNLKEI